MNLYLDGIIDSHQLTATNCSGGPNLVRFREPVATSVVGDCVGPGRRGCPVQDHDVPLGESKGVPLLQLHKRCSRIRTNSANLPILHQNLYS